MNEVKIPLDNFDLKSFIGSSSAFIREQGTGNPAPVTAIPVVEKDGTTPNLYEHAAGRVLHDEILEDKKSVFFPFSNPNTGDSMMCADGRSYNIPKPGVHTSQNDAGLTISPSETVGYVVKTAGDQLSFNFAVQHLGGGGSQAYVDTSKDVGLLENPMKEYLDSFKLE